MTSHEKRILAAGAADVDRPATPREAIAAERQDVGVDSVDHPGGRADDGAAARRQTTAAGTSEPLAGGDAQLRELGDRARRRTRREGRRLHA